MAEISAGQPPPSKTLANYAIGATILGLLVALISEIGLSILLADRGLTGTGSGRLTLFILLTTVSFIGQVILGAIALILGVLSLQRGEPARAAAGISIGFGMTGAPLLLGLISRAIG